MESLWLKNAEKPNFKSLDCDMETDVLIVGGGLTGILCGYMLKKAGVDCVISEARTICGGVTKNTTAKITCHHGAIFDKMISRYGVDNARLYVKAHQSAVDEYRRLAKSIDCDFEDAVSVVYSRDDSETVRKEAVALNKLGCSVGFTKNTALPFSVVGAVVMKGQAQFHPLKFAYALAKRLTIFENTEVTDITPSGAVTKNGIIKAKKIIVATHFPFLNSHGLYFMKLYQHRSYVLALDNITAPRGMYIDASGTGLSFRRYKDMLLLGGGGHRTGKNGGGWNELIAFASKYYPKAKEVCRYATQDCKSLDDIAYIGMYSKNTPSLYVASGFNKWGMTTAMVAAKVLADMICDKENEYSRLFSPSRSILRKQLFVNAGESILGLLTPTTPRCTHLGCALKYNKQEHSWDCGCHGSRFSEGGRIIDNPATKNLKHKS